MMQATKLSRLSTWPAQSHTVFLSPRPPPPPPPLINEGGGSQPLTACFHFIAWIQNNAQHFSCNLSYVQFPPVCPGNTFLFLFCFSEKVPVDVMCSFSMSTTDATARFTELIRAGDVEGLKRAAKAGQFDPGGPRKLSKETQFTEVCLI